MIGDDALPRAGDPRTAPGVMRFCNFCSRRMDGPDACLATIPGVSHACCGHGDPEEAYVVLGGVPDQPAYEIDTLTLRGSAALAFFRLTCYGAYKPAEAAA